MLRRQRRRQIPKLLGRRGSRRLLHPQQRVHISGQGGQVPKGIGKPVDGRLKGEKPGAVDAPPVFTVFTAVWGVVAADRAARRGAAPWRMTGGKRRTRGTIGGTSADAGSGAGTSTSTLSSRHDVVAVTGRRVA